MSLVPTWVRMNDGKFYQNPVIAGAGWYICFDDDDPPELVVSVPCHRHIKEFFNGDINAFFEALEIPAELDPPKQRGIRCGRCFGKSMKIQNAVSFWLRLTARPPVERMITYNGRPSETKPTADCVIYDPPEKTN